MAYDAHQTYFSYFRLGETAYREKVRFYEENPDAISSLYFDERIEVDIDYVLSLFEIGKYERFLRKIDPLLEVIIFENIFKYKNENIFNELLFRKAACLFQLNNYTKAEEILLQLIRMEKSNALYIGLYTISRRKHADDFTTTIRAMANASFLLILGITIARIFFIEPFFDTMLEPFLILRNFLFVFSVVCLFGTELIFQYKIYKSTGVFSHKLMNKIFNKR